MDSPVTLSRETLRAELLSLELRLIEKLVSKTELEALSARVIHIDRQLQDKADRRDVASRREIQEMIRTAHDRDTDRGWTSKERWLSVGLFVLTIGSLAVSLYIASHYGRGVTP